MSMLEVIIAKGQKALAKISLRLIIGFRSQRAKAIVVLFPPNSHFYALQVFSAEKDWQKWVC